MVDKNLVFLLHEKGHGYSDIARIVGVSRQRVHVIITGYTSERNWRAISKAVADGAPTELSSKCQVCYEPAEVVHHKDKNSRNNVPANLMSLCKKCHYRIHSGVKRVIN